MIRQHRDSFIVKQREANAAAIVLMLHFYLKLVWRSCDYVIVVHASAKTIGKRH